MEDSLRVPGHNPGSEEPQGHVRLNQTDNLSLRSAEKRIELLHDVVSIRSSASRRPRSVYVPPKKSVWQRFKDGFRTVIAFIFSNVGICVLVLGYLILGAFMFQYIEEPESVEESPMVSKRRTAVMKLWNITERYNTLHKTNWSEAVKSVIAEYQEEVIEAIDEGFDGKDIPDNLWSFSGALLYSITVITTIGVYRYSNYSVCSICSTCSIYR